MSFDSIRAAHVAAMAYLCKEVKPPAELLGCWPCNSSTKDVSRYNRGNIYTSSTSEFSTSFTPNALTTSANVWPTFNIYPNALNLASPWSFEAWINSGLPIAFGLGGLKARIRTYSGDYGDGSGLKMLWNNNQIYGNGNVFTGLSLAWSHHALAYDGSTLRYYYNGSLKVSQSASISGTVNLATLEFEYNSSTSSVTKGVANIRAVQKNLGSSSGYPVTSTSFTGFETL